MKPLVWRCSGAAAHDESGNKSNKQTRNCLDQDGENEKQPIVCRIFAVRWGNAWPQLNKKKRCFEEEFDKRVSGIALILTKKLKDTINILLNTIVIKHLPENCFFVVQRVFGCIRLSQTNGNHFVSALLTRQNNSSLVRRMCCKGLNVGDGTQINCN